MTPPPLRSPASDDAMARAVIENLRVSLFEVFRVNLQRTGEMIVRGKTFRNCTLEGPGVLLPIDGSVIETCQLGDALGDMRNLLMQPVGGKVIGALVYAGCTFEDCQFINVGFTGAPDFLNALVSSALRSAS
jgi:hypothetical protein